MTEDNQVVIYKVESGIARITLNRPDKRNALNDQLIAGLKASFGNAHRDDTVRAVILNAAGQDFCSGADLSALQKISTATVAENLDDARSLMELFVLIRNVRVPVIAAVRGRALAGGCGLATACDLVLAADSARFGYPEVKIGFVPAMVMAILRRNVSEKRAFELITRGDEIDAHQAKEMGLVNQVFSEASFLNEVETYVQRYLKTSKTAVELTKKLLYQIDSLSFVESLETGVDVNVIARMTDDCQQGIAKFLKK